MENTPHRTPENLSRPAAFLEVKRAILNCASGGDVHEAEKMITRYILNVCEKPLRAERKLDLVYMMNWKISQLRADGIEMPEPQAIAYIEIPKDTLMHKFSLRNR